MRLAKYFLLLALLIALSHFAFNQNEDSKEDTKEETDTLPVFVRRLPWAVCNTSKGLFKFELRQDLAPNGTDYMIKAIESGYFNHGIPFFRVNSQMTQFGITKRPVKTEDPFLSTRYGAQRDLHPYGGYNETARKMFPWKRGTIASIGGRSLVIAFKPNGRMGTHTHDAPLGFIEEKYMVDVFDKLYRYNDIINYPSKGGVTQSKLMRKGMEYIEEEFPLTDRITSCCIEY